MYSVLQMSDSEEQRIVDQGEEESGEQAARILPLEQLADDDDETTRISYFRSEKFVELCVCLVPVVVGLALEFPSIHPRQRPIPYQLLSDGEIAVNQVYNEVFDGETISTVLLIILAIVAPLFIVLPLAWFRGEFHEILCVCVMGVGLTLAITDALKLYVGYLRPIFYDQCEPDFLEQTCGNESLGRKSRLSFPSGHSSLMLCSTVIVSLFLERKFGVSSIQVYKVQSLGEQMSSQVQLVYKQPPSVRRLVSIACLAPALGGVFVAASRLVDNKHFPADVVGGALLGGSIGVWIYRTWFPALPLATAPPNYG